MRLKRILALPLALAADIVSLGNIGGYRSFTQQVFDEERNERSREYELSLLREAARILEAKDRK